MHRPGEKWRHLALLISILFLFIATPVIEVFRQGVLIMNVVAVGVLVTATYALSRRKTLFVIAVFLSGVSIVSTWLLIMTQRLEVAIFSHSCVVTLILYFSVTSLDYVLSGSRITMDKIFAAICVYLLLGYAWTFAYAIVEELDPGSFVALSNTPREYVDRVLEMRHFSFMTLTTVGYGDIVPRSSAARTLAGIEAITGQIYLTVLVARLVGLHIVHGQTRRTGED
jgi:hypothetical protein